MTGLSPVVRAFFYLQFTSLFNSLRQRLRRLRQPKYLFGALAGGAYLYFFLVRQVLQGGPHGRHEPLGALPSEFSAQLVALAALLLLIVVVFAWLIPSDRAALRFSEAEVAFLFPAPLSRVTLIQFSLLRSQLGIFFSAFLVSLLLRRGSTGGGALEHATGLWLVLSTLKLHFLGASFARERMLEFGVRPALRRSLMGLLVLLVAAGCWWWLRTHVSLPRREDLQGAAALLNYSASILDAPPLSWLLAPFKLLAAPFFAADIPALLRAMLPALGLLLVHYFWVLRSCVSFEEASIDLARRRAERLSAMRDGKMRFRNTPTKARTAPFRLAAHGFAPIAFLWKGLIALGPLWRLRTWLIACAIVIVGSRWLAADPARAPLLQITGGFAAVMAGWLFLAAPMFMQRGLRQTFEHLDILKASPLHGWQIALGELLSPVVVVAFVQWFLLLVAVLSFDAKSDAVLLTAVNIAVGAAGIALLAAPLIGLMLCVPFAGLLYFPAWTVASASNGGGFEVIGQRMIFMGGYLFTLVVALIPVVVVAGLAFVITRLIAAMPVALLVSALLAGVVLAVELAAVVLWLGKRIDCLDVSQEMR